MRDMVSVPGGFKGEWCRKMAHLRQDCKRKREAMPGGQSVNKKMLNMLGGEGIELKMMRRRNKAQEM